MSVQYYYKYAEIDPDTGLCLGVFTDTSEVISPIFIPIPVDDPEYLFKYYNQADCCWYEDAAFTIPWQSSLI